MREVVIDTETTGLSYKNGDRIIEVGCVELINHVATNNFLQFYCKVDKEISESAQKITGITNRFLSDKNNFGDHLKDALFGYLNNWRKSLDGSLALIILTDQFTRNIFRGTARSFYGDKLALDTCLHCLYKFDIGQQTKERSHFILNPSMYSESLKIQEESLPILKEHTTEKSTNMH